MPPTSSTLPRRSSSIASMSSLPASILEKSRMSLMTISSESALRADRFGVVALRAIERRVEQQAGHADDAVHRRADFMADVREELALGAIGRFGGLGRAQQRFARGARFGHVLQRAGQAQRPARRRRVRPWRARGTSDSRRSFVRRRISTSYGCACWKCACVAAATSAHRPDAGTSAGSSCGWRSSSGRIAEQLADARRAPGRAVALRAPTGRPACR